MKLTSSSFQNGNPIPKKHSYHNQNVSPQLAIQGVPKSAKTLVLIVHDPDAPVGDYTHWLIWNIDSITLIIDEGSVPEAAVQGLNDFGNNRWDGPAPPSGTHRYMFELYAIDNKLDLDKTCGKIELLDSINKKIIDKATLTGTYSAN